MNLKQLDKKYFKTKEDKAYLKGFEDGLYEAAVFYKKALKSVIKDIKIGELTFKDHIADELKLIIK